MSPRKNWSFVESAGEAVYTSFLEVWEDKGRPVTLNEIMSFAKKEGIDKEVPSHESSPFNRRQDVARLLRLHKNVRESESKGKLVYSPKEAPKFAVYRLWGGKEL